MDARCTYLKRNAKLCQKPAYEGRGALCSDHVGAIPYKLCAGEKCGGVVSTKHGRPKCTTCDRNSAARASREKTGDARLRRILDAKRVVAKNSAEAAPASTDDLVDEMLKLFSK